jgi:hypothetical protein
MTTDHDIDDAMGTSGADEAVAAFPRRIGAVRSRPAPKGPAILTPPISLPCDHAAARRADVDFYRLLDRMRTGVGADRIVADVESARASAVGSAPALFVNGDRFSGDLDAATVWAALQGAPPRPSRAQGAAERFR